MCELFRYTVDCGEIPARNFSTMSNFVSIRVRSVPRSTWQCTWAGTPAFDVWEVRKPLSGETKRKPRREPRWSSKPYQTFCVFGESNPAIGLKSIILLREVPFVYQPNRSENTVLQTDHKYSILDRINVWVHGVAAVQIHPRSPLRPNSVSASLPLRILDEFLVLRLLGT